MISKEISSSKAITAWDSWLEALGLCLAHVIYCTTLTTPLTTLPISIIKVSEACEISNKLSWRLWWLILKGLCHVWRLNNAWISSWLLGNAWLGIILFVSFLHCTLMPLHRRNIVVRILHACRGAEAVFGIITSAVCRRAKADFRWFEARRMQNIFFLTSGNCWNLNKPENYFLILSYSLTATIDNLQVDFTDVMTIKHDVNGHRNWNSGRRSKYAWDVCLPLPNNIVRWEYVSIPRLDPDHWVGSPSKDELLVPARVFASSHLHWCLFPFSSVVDN